MLLNPIKIYSARYNLMDLEVTVNEDSIVLKQNLAVVFDLELWTQSSSWSFLTVFDRLIPRKCLLAKSKLSIEGKEVTDFVDLDLGVEKSEVGNMLKPSGLLATRYITGSGQEHGTIKTCLENVSGQDIEVTVLEVLPWIFKTYCHTIKSSVPFTRQLFSPAVDRVKPAQIEYQLTIPANSQVTVEMDFDMTLLRYSEYTFSPARGFDIPGAIIDFRPVGETSANRIITETLLLTVPLPDFTMPFNVIMLTCLAMTFCYGVTFNLMFRRWYLPDPANPRTIAEKVSFYLAKLKTKLKKE